MATSIDELQIEINAQAVKANQAIDTLVKKIDKLTVSVGSLDTSKLNSLSSSISNISTSMKSLDGIKADGFASVTRNIKALNKIDSSNLAVLSNNVRQISSAFSGMTGTTEAVTNLNALANGIKQLGYKSADKAIGNIPQLAKAMKQLMAELSTAPKVSRNIIDMTNALAKLARTGASSGKAATSISKAFDGIYRSSGKASLGILNLSGKFKSLFRRIMPFIGIWQMFSFAKQAVEISSDLTEVQNVVDVTFGDFKQKIEDLASVSIPELGMSELTTKQIASRFQAMGTAMGIAQGNMADMSVELTRLTGDMASFYNVEQKAVGEDLEAIFTGQTKPLRQYGLDLTEATLQEWALKQGIDANVNSMSQMEKTMLRYQYVLANTKAAQGDFLRTQDTWANQIRILKEQIKQLASIIGGVFINALKPLVKALNAAMSKIIAFAKVISDALGKIFGWTYEVGGGTTMSDDFGSAADSADDLAGSTGKAAKNIKDMKAGLRAFDELKTINLPDSTNADGAGGGSGIGGIGGGSGAGADGGMWKKSEQLPFESDIDTLYKLGETISKALIGAMESIDWDKVYEKAKGFGKGLASFLNGLFAGQNGKTLFGEVGRTIASALNTVIYAALSFGEEFNFKQFGYNIADGINNFFRTFDFKALAKTINVWVKGIKDALVTAIKNIDWKAVFKGIKDFVTELDIDTVGIIIGAFLIRKIIKAEIAKTALDFIGGKISKKLAGAIAAKLGVDATWGAIGKGIILKIGAAISANAPLILKALGAIGLSIAMAIGGWHFGQLINEKLTGEEIDMSFMEQLNTIKESFIDGSWQNALEMWGNDIRSKFNELHSFISGYLPNKLQPVFDNFGILISNTLQSIQKYFIGFINYIQGIFTLNWKQAWQGAVDAFKGIFNGIITIVEYVLNNIVNKINSVFSGINSIGSAIGFDINIPQIPKITLERYEYGGFPQKYSLFMAGENGIPEIAGTVGGKTAVAGGAEITGIRDEIRSASTQEMALMRQQNALLQALLEKETGISVSDVGKAAKNYARDFYNRTGKNAYQFS